MTTSLLSQALSEPTGNATLPWYAVKVRTNGESRVRNTLLYRGYETYLPTYIECRRYSDRVKKIDTALFPGYLFCRLDVNRRLPVLSAPGVEALVSLGGYPQIIGEHEIEAIQRVVNSSSATVSWPYLQTGDLVTVAFGALAGISGYLLRFQGKDRLVISIHLLQRSISVEINRSWVNPVCRIDARRSGS